jgi:hypothetical protein
MVFSRSSIIQHEVFLIGNLKNPPMEAQPEMKCVIICRSTDKNLQRIVSILKNPLYAQYYIYFTNAISLLAISKLAEADQSALVQQIQVNKFILLFIYLEKGSVSGLLHNEP